MINIVSLSAAQITGIVSLVLILSGVVIVEVMEESYYCESEDNVKECLRLSSSGLTCYYLGADDITKGDRCTGGSVWEPLEPFARTDLSTDILEDPTVVKVRANGKVWTCDKNKGFVDAYTRCNSGSYSGYLGEFI